MESLGDRHVKKFGGKIFIANGGREDVFGMIGSRGKGSTLNVEGLGIKSVQ